MVIPAHAPGPSARRSPLAHPARLVTVAFASAIIAGTLLLSLPIALDGPGRASVVVAGFTATSAVTVTGLVLVDTATAWSPFGEAVIIILIQLGGIGIMTLASLVMLGISRRLGLRHRLVAQMETGVLSLGEVRRVVRNVLVLSAVAESITAVVLVLRFWLTYDEPFLHALWLGVFHAISAFNNAGFALWEDSLVRFVTDPVVNLAVGGAIVVGGLGVPVLAELVQDRLRWSRFTLHTRLTLTWSAILLVVAWILITWFEWTNPATLGDKSALHTMLGGFFQAVTPRTAGFNTIDIGAMRETSLLVTTALMFIGAAPVSTGGGIKVTTFGMLAFVILSEVRGDRDVMLFGRRIPPAAERQALSIALIGIGVIAISTVAVMSMGDWGLSAVLFEVTSAFGTVGLSTGITSQLPVAGEIILVALMFAGRVGPLTVGAALAVRTRDARYRLPEERPLIG